MSQLNLNVTPDFERDLKRFMEARGVRTKSEAIRALLREAIDRLEQSSNTVDFSSWVGMAKAAPENRRRRFKSHDDLWAAD